MDANNWCNLRLINSTVCEANKNSFVAGRCLNVACRALANAAHGPRVPTSVELAELGRYVKSCLSKMSD